jgi:hypothetical protein
VGASDIHKTSKISDKILRIHGETWYGDTTCSGKGFAFHRIFF